jgi:enterochelin esterase-like enzyme
VTGVRVPVEPAAVRAGAWADDVAMWFRVTDPDHALAGGLAMLHAHCRYPGVFGGLFLQSGSFFVPRLDSQERRFPYYRRITAFTAAMRAHGVPGAPVPVVMTCGSIEENIGNNRLMPAVLRSGGYPAALHEVPDVHNYTAWRDAFHPYLTELVAEVTR